MKLMRYDNVSNEHWHAVWNSNKWKLLKVQRVEKIIFKNETLIL
jgi:hypothetical protein